MPFPVIRALDTRKVYIQLWLRSPWFLASVPDNPVHSVNLQLAQGFAVPDSLQESCLAFFLAFYLPLAVICPLPALDKS